ncbi:MAG: hypothetical protein A3F72_00080 [Bacteroidetes bacterium RIFCSPLOWO2_12_FULL_35_15]|nr:MAG: hypothetical protein A3F72_00080 [Bacteroidetes bacterium RIFCSPLOWO2_12_FULL_35_15]
MKSKTIFCLTLLTILVTGCKKYPEGPWLSLKTPIHRIDGNSSKMWVVDYFSINGNDSSAYFKTPFYGKYTFYKAERDHNSKFDFVSSSNSFSGEFFLNKAKTDITMERYTLTKGIMPPNDSVWNKILNWEIQRLTNVDFWLKGNFNGKEYYMKLKY